MSNISLFVFVEGLAMFHTYEQMEFLPEDLEVVWRYGISFCVASVPVEQDKSCIVHYHPLFHSSHIYSRQSRLPSLRVAALDEKYDAQSACAPAWFASFRHGDCHDEERPI